jgi:hypothetical protein
MGLAAMREQIRQDLEAIREGSSALVRQRHVLSPGTNAWSIWERGECHCGPARWPARSLEEAVTVFERLEGGW